MTDPATPLRKLGRYLLFGAIAQGGMASVHFGRLLGAGGFTKTVAIKRLHAQFGDAPELVAMLADEARLVSRIQHTNVVPTLDLVEEGGELFLVMEYVAGESLARLLRSAAANRTPVPIAIAIAITAGFLHGLHAAHTAQNELGEPLHIVHRDVSPHNVLVGVDGLARMLDFGVAKARGRLQTTRAGQAKGKIPYMAPEQITCDVVTPRTDVYAAGVVLWETLTARRLFHGENEGHVVHRVLEGATEPPSAYAPEVPPALDRLVERALSRDSEARFGSALELADALEAVVAPATPRQVAQWLGENAAEALAARSAQLGRIERAPLEPRAPEQATPLPGALSREPSVVGVETTTTVVGRSAPARRDRAPFAIPVAAAALVVALGAVAWFRGTSTPPAAAAPDRAPEGVAAPSVAPSETVTPPPATVETPAASATSAPTVPARGAGARLPPPRTTRGPDPCDPPWVTDANGIKHWKSQCK